MGKTSEREWQNTQPIVEEAKQQERGGGRKRAFFLNDSWKEAEGGEKKLVGAQDKIFEEDRPYYEGAARLR